MGFVGETLTGYFEHFQMVLEALGAADENAQNEQAQAAEFWLNSTIASDAGEIAFLRTGLARTITMEAVSLSRSDSPGEFSLYRYVGRGENVQEAYNIRTSETRDFFNEASVLDEAHKILGSSGSDVTLGIVRRVAITARYNADTGRVVYSHTLDTQPLRNEANIYGEVLHSKALAPLATIEELNRLRIYQASYEKSVADTLSVTEAAALAALSAARDNVADKLQRAVEDYNRALAEAREAAGLAIAGALLGLAGQIANLADASEMQDKLDALDAKVDAVSTGQQELQAATANMAAKLSELKHKPPPAYHFINFSFTTSVYVAPFAVPEGQPAPAPQP